MNEHIGHQLMAELRTRAAVRDGEEEATLRRYLIVKAAASILARPASWCSLRRRRPAREVRSGGPEPRISTTRRFARSCAPWSTRRPSVPPQVAGDEL